MKRLALALSIIILLVILSPVFSIYAQPSHTPHENPATTGSSPDSIALLLAYGSVFDFAATRQYQDAHRLLIELEKAHIPDEIEYIIEQYSTLSRQLFNALNYAESLLDEASKLFTSNQLADARAKLDSAGVTIGEAQFLLKDIETATSKLADSLGIFAASALGQTRQAFARLQESLERLRQLTDELNQLRESLKRNPRMIIKTSFHYATSLEISAPGTAYPGLPFTINGQVSSTGSHIDRTVRILLDNTQLIEATIRDEFSFDIITPPQTSTGKHNLTIMVPPQGRYLGASRKLDIGISRIPLQADIQVPQLIIVPRTIQVSGKISHQLAPVSGAGVNLAFKQSSATVITAADGSFTTSLDVPFDLHLIGPQELIVTVAPVEPWYAVLQTETRILAINPANLGLMLVVFLSFGLLTYTRTRNRPTLKRKEEVIPHPPTTETPRPALTTRPRYQFTGTRGSILSAYKKSLVVVENSAGIPMTAHITLREYLKIVTPQLPDAAKPFTELTAIAEVALYSAHRLNVNTATKAEQLAATIQGELYNEPA